MSITIWRGSEDARSYGATHHAWFMGIIPGFWGEEQSIWVPRSDLLCWLEDALSFIWVNMRLLRDEEPDFMVSIGREIEQREKG